MKKTLYVDGIPKTKQNNVVYKINRHFGNVEQTYIYKDNFNLIHVSVLKIGNTNFGIDGSFLYDLKDGIDNIEQHTTTLNNGFRFYVKKHNLVYSNFLYDKEQNKLNIFGLTKDGLQKVYTLSTNN